MDNKRKILIVDDDKVNATILIKLLGKRDFECIYAQDAKECFQVLNSQNIDLVLLDIVMPNVSGLEVLEKIRKTKDNFVLPVIMVTSRDDSKDVVKGLKTGANDYLTKPINIEIAVARIRTQISLKDLFRESLKNKQITTINTMVTTLHHEINNPLAIAVGNLSLGIDNINEKRVEKSLQALDRITEIVKKIEQITSSEMEEVDYSGSSTMFKIN